MRPVVLLAAVCLPLLSVAQKKQAKKPAVYFAKDTDIDFTFKTISSEVAVSYFMKADSLFFRVDDITYSLSLSDIDYLETHIDKSFVHSNNTSPASRVVLTADEEKESFRSRSKTGLVTNVKQVALLLPDEAAAKELVTYLEEANAELVFGSLKDDADSDKEKPVTTTTTVTSITTAEPVKEKPSVSIPEMFTSKEAEDYKFVVFGNGMYNNYTLSYYLENDSLHVLYHAPMFGNTADNHYRAALNTIDFQKSSSSMDPKWLNEDKSTKAANIVLQVKPGNTFRSSIDDRFSFYKSVLKEVTLLFPDIATAKAAFAYLKDPAPASAGSAGSSPATVKTATAKEVTPQEVCDAVLKFVNEMSQNGFETYMGTVASTEMLYGRESRKYNSTVSFPQGITTIISDTNRLSRFRTAEVLLMEESANGTSVSAEMKDYYNRANAIFKICLESQKFVTSNPASDPLHQHAMSASYRFVKPDDDANPFAAMQVNRGLVVEVYIDQRTTGGSSKNSLSIRFRRG